MSLGTIELMPPVSVTGTTLLETHSPFDWYDIYVDLRYAIMYLLIDTALIDILYWYFHLILWFLGSLWWWMIIFFIFQLNIIGLYL